MTLLNTLLNLHIDVPQLLHRMAMAERYILELEKRVEKLAGEIKKPV